MLPLAGVYAIYDHPHPGGQDPSDVVGAMLAGGEGAQVVQLRAKTATVAERRALSEQLAARCRVASVPFFVNDDCEASTSDIAGVTGVHVGQDDLAVDAVASLAGRLHARGQWLGVSTHDVEQVRRANASGAHYIGFGPVFTTVTKANPDPVVGVDGLAAACRVSDVPVVAIGGITLANASSCMVAGAAAVAVIGALGQRTLGEVATAARALRRAVASR